MRKVSERRIILGNAETEYSTLELGLSDGKIIFYVAREKNEDGVPFF